MDPSNTRKVYAPYSTSGEQVGQTPLTGYVDVAQAIYPAVNTGQISTDGEWSGVLVSDKLFFDFQTDLAIANGADIISNKVIDTYGYNKLNIGLNVSRAGDYNFLLLFGGDDNDSYLNLNPINTAGQPKATIRTDSSTNAFSTLLNDAETIGADVWNIFQVNNLEGFKLKLKIVNNSGGNANIQTAIQRLI